jgi:hypothetical protein
MSTTDADGMNGIFVVPVHNLLNSGHKVTAVCIVSDGTNPDLTEFIPWEHVSCRIMEFGKSRMPTWDEMCVIKDVFWGEDEVVVQFHPAKKDYVNFHPHVLHLWKSKKEPFPTPPKICV